MNRNLFAPRAFIRSIGDHIQNRIIWADRPKLLQILKHCCPLLNQNNFFLSLRALVIRCHRYSWQLGLGSGVEVGVKHACSGPFYRLFGN